MNNYFKNYALLAFFSFFVMPALAMESGNTTPSQAQFIAKFLASTYLPKEKEQQNEQNAENWFNEGKKPENQPIDPLLAYFIKRGDNVPKIDRFLFDSDYQVNSLHFKLPKQNKKININKFHFEKRDNLQYKSPPLDTSDLVSPVNGRKEPLPQRMQRQNCLIM
jgi:hypothetical protein